MKGRMKGGEDADCSHFSTIPFFQFFLPHFHLCFFSFLFFPPLSSFMSSSLYFSFLLSFYYLFFFLHPPLFLFLPSFCLLSSFSFLRSFLLPLLPFLIAFFLPTSSFPLPFFFLAPFFVFSCLSLSFFLFSSFLSLDKTDIQTKITGYAQVLLSRDNIYKTYIKQPCMVQLLHQFCARRFFLNLRNRNRKVASKGVTCVEQNIRLPVIKLICCQPFTLRSAGGNGIFFDSITKLGFFYKTARHFTLQ